MKSIYKVLTMIMVIACVFSFGTIQVLAAEDLSLSFEKVGEISADDFDYRNYTFYDDSGIMTRGDDGEYIVLNVMGQNVLGRSYNRAEPFGNGYFLVYDAENAPNYLGLVKADGTVLIPCEAAIIDEISDRYLQVAYATEEVDDRDEAYMYVKKNLFDLSPNEDSVLYAGYARVYDLQEMQFVEGIEIDDPSIDIMTLGENLLVFESGEPLHVYHPDGSELGEHDWNKLFDNHFILYDEENRSEIYDSEYEYLLTIDFYPDEIFGEAEAFGVYDRDEDAHYLVDKNGEKLSEFAFEYTPDACGGFIYGHNDEDVYCVLDMEGNVILSEEDNAVDVEPWRDGYLVVEFEDDSVGIILPDGDVAKGQEDFIVEGKNGDEVFVLNDKDYSLKLDDVNVVSEFLVEDDSDKEDAMGLYSVINGKQLLDYKYDRIEYAGGYVYAHAGDKWEVYSAVVQ